MKTQILLSSIIPVLTLLTACGGGSDSSSGDQNASEAASSRGSTTSIAGLWDATDADGDIQFYDISADGELIVYDYMNDAVDNVGNCYLALGPLAVSNEGNNRYSVSVQGLTEPLTIVAEVVDGTLTGVDMTGQSFTAPPVIGMTVGELTICT